MPGFERQGLSGVCRNSGLLCRTLEGRFPYPFPRRRTTLTRLLFGALGVCPKGSNPFRAGEVGDETLLRAEANSGLCAPPAGRPGVPSAFELRGGGLVSDPGKPYRGNLSGVTSSQVTSPGLRGARGFPQRRLSRNCARHRSARGSRRGLQRAFTTPRLSRRSCAAPGEARRAPAGAMGRSGCRCCCPPPARARREPRRWQPQAAGRRVTVAAPGSVARAWGHVEEPRFQ